MESAQNKINPFNTEKRLMAGSWSPTIDRLL